VRTTLESRFVDAAGVRLHYIEAGSTSSEPPIVLVHGLGSTVTKWRDALPMMAARRRTLAVDLPGFGRSDAPRANYTFGYLAGGVRAFLDAMEIDRCLLVGNSLGGVTGMWLAASWPERVAGLVLVDPALPLPAGVRPDVATSIRWLLASLPGVGEVLYTGFTRIKSAEEQVADGLKRNIADPTRVSAETLRLMREETEERRTNSRLRGPLMSAQRHLLWMMTARRAQVERVAESITAPTLIVWGSEDLMVPVVVGEDWVGRIPGAELLVIDGAGHNPQVEVPDRFSEIVLAFADRLETGAVSSPSGTRVSRG
jgi:pimeloyl-ACP methyl ester carboxylesterase